MFSRIPHSSPKDAADFARGGAPHSIGVLLVDSRPVVLRGLTELIDAHRPRMHVIGQCTSYARAIFLTEEARPDVVVTSFFRDTLEPMAALATLLRFQHARVLVLKGMHENIPVGKALGLGAAGVVIAEDPTESIVKAIEQVFRSETRQPARAWVGGLSRLTLRDGDRTDPDGEYEKLARLTLRERELIQAIVANPSAKYIAIGAQLGISEHTVHNHLSSIYHKLNLINRTDLLVYAVKHRIGGDDDSAASGWVGLE